MKKIFTLIAAAVMAASVNAQETFVASEVPTSGQVIENATASTKLAFGPDTYKTLSDEVKVEGYTTMISGNANPKDADNKNYSASNKNLPVTGCYYVITPSKEGTIAFSGKLNSGKSFFVTDGEGTLVESVTLTAADGTALTLDDNRQISANSQFTASFAAKANTSYYVFCTGSKLSFCGYSFTAGTTGINAVESATAADGKAYNVSGQEVDNSFKGIVVKNGKKYVKK